MPTDPVHPSTDSVLQRALEDVLTPLDDADETTARIIDAAYELFSRTGIQRASMEDVARRAGVSRITVYRRVESKDALVVRVVRREFRRYLIRFQEDIAAAATAEDRVVAGFASALRAVRDNPLIGGIMAVEPEVIVPSLVEDDGRTMAAVSAFVAVQLRHEQQAGHVAPEVDVDLVAELMVRLSASFLITPSSVVDLDDDAQVRDLARRFLVPMLRPSSA